jgi:ribose transport system substrate-binding protein
MRLEPERGPAAKTARYIGGAAWKTVILCLAGYMLAAGIGSRATAQTTSAAITEAQRLVAAAEQPLKNWQPPGGPFDASKARGKSIWYVSLNLAIPFEQYMLQGIKEGAAVVGAKGVGFDGKSQVSEFTRGIEEAVQAKAAVIMIGGIQPKLVGPAMAAAKQAGIPLIVANTQDPGPPLPEYASQVVASATHSFSVPGKVEADFIVADSQANASVIFITSSDIPVICGLEQDAFTREMARLCPKCHAIVVDVPTSQWNNLAPKTASLIRANPAVTYLVPVFDGMVIYMVPGVTSADAQSRVKIVSFNATPSVMQDLKRHYVVVAETGGPNLLQGWAFADEALRVLSGVRPLNDLGIPNRLFTAQNIDSIDLTKPEWTWYGPLDFQAKYRSLWKH